MLLHSTDPSVSPPGTYDSIAAVTATADGSARRNAPVHVYVNPEVTAGLRRAGAQVVMSHELVHVATDAATSPVEPWLLEGFADYVALRDVALPDATTLGRAIELVRRDGPPDQLPGPAEFDTRAAGPAGGLRAGLAGLPDRGRTAGGARSGGGLQGGDARGAMDQHCVPAGLHARRLSSVGESACRDSASDGPDSISRLRDVGERTEGDR